MCIECRHKSEAAGISGAPFELCDWCKPRLRVDIDAPHKPDDPINPSHYTHGGIEVIDALEAWGLDKDFCLGNTVKYVARHKHKGKPLEDLKKARWYLDRRIAQMEKET